LVAARLLTVTRQRRFSYYRIASPLVATMLESIKVVAAIEVPPRRQPRSANEDALCFARSCYDHLAGRVGVAVTDALVAMGHIVLTDEGGEVTSSGERFLSAFGADLRPRTRRIFCQPCLDWSERRYHIKGLVGARILDRLLELGWFKRVSNSRALQLTSSGRAGLSEIFQIEINNEGVPTGRLSDSRRLTASAERSVISRKCGRSGWLSCPLLAQSRHAGSVVRCPLSGAKRTLQCQGGMSAVDPKRTSAAQDCCRAT
jgi:predicted transcriptional regulator